VIVAFARVCCCLLLLAACRSAPPGPAPEPSGVRAVVLGTAQDGGVPQVGCACARCERALADPAARRRRAALGVVAGGRAFLVDAGPDVAEQAAALRPAPVAGVFLTHAHVGHYLGLAFFGREGMGARALPVHATARMRAFLEANAPWSLLLRHGHVELRDLSAGTAARPADGLAFTPVAVPHRDELSDTVGFVIAGPRRRLLYVPDADRWDGWPRDLAALLDEVDVALLDGTFFSARELPGRNLAEIPHPPIERSLERFRGARARIGFTHFNHSNPVLDPGSAEARAVEAAGFFLAREGMTFEL
jgi:pyrroloquinoline quinone biosynthesis protein B